MLGIIAIIIAVLLAVFGIAAIVYTQHNKRVHEKNPKAFEHDENSGYGRVRIVDGYDENAPKNGLITGLISFVIAALLALGSMLYGQDIGEVVVLRNLGGSLSGYTSEAGFHAKAPWQSTVSYDVRNNIISLYRDAEYKTDGGSAEGSCVTINDKSGATADMDVQVIYSLDGGTALKLYADYGSQENFTNNYILNSVRSITREVAGKYGTMSLLTDRGDFTNGLTEELQKRWKDVGLNVESVSVQDVRYSDEITKKYADAQAAEVEKAKAQNEQETAKVQAETKRIEAEGEAKANDVLNKSLSEKVIQKQYIDALKKIGDKGNLVVVPEGSTPFVNVGGK